MRELKFRLWDDNTKRWVSRGESVEVAFSQAFPESIKAEANFYLEQYTGLKDKNGKEVYEGDIVKSGGRVYEVDWLEKDGGWFCFTEDDYYTPLYHIECEVIGNIHENKELLGE